jgi:hypothetical protein
MSGLAKEMFCKEERTFHNNKQGVLHYGKEKSDIFGSHV